MTSHSAVIARRKTVFGRTLVLTALFVVAAAGSVLCARSARADAPVAPSKGEVSAEAQAVAGVFVAQSMGNPAIGASLMQVLWGGGAKPEPPKGSLFALNGDEKANRTGARRVPTRAAPRMRQTPSAK